MRVFYDGGKITSSKNLLTYYIDKEKGVGHLPLNHVAWRVNLLRLVVGRTGLSLETTHQWTQARSDPGRSSVLRGGIMFLLYQ